MTARLLDGRALAAGLRAEVAARCAALPYRPGLAVVLVGDNAASAVYVRSKDRAAREAGLDARTLRLPQATPHGELLGVIAGLNADREVDGILVQLPLPPQIEARAVLEAIDPEKDVDGFHPANVARLVGEQPGLAPCTRRWR